MQSPRHLLVATDLSPAARMIYSRAAALARDIGADVTLLHVVQSLTPTSQGELVGTIVAPPDPMLDRADALAALERDAEAFDGEVALEVLVSDRVPQAIADYASDNDMDLIVVSTHGRSGFRRLVLGSVAEGVIRHSAVPVLCFPAKEGQA